ncbi:hypothetical protein [Variovorax sp. N23]|uniref:hypothetical protein n=1 Tax=Variovorax sp. N23 TaxID=2980555 RepID=UPI0021C5D459|nr:hypothetical protein [Variovorax sp. N23]MCU4119746.1 hypothetical protein [Variovorax sp. N23]
MPALDGSAPDERDPRTGVTRALITGALIGRTSTRTVFSYSSNGVLQSIDIVVPEGSAADAFNRIVRNARRLPGNDIAFKRGQTLARLIRPDPKLADAGLAPATARIELMTPAVLEARTRSAADRRTEETMFAIAVLTGLLLIAAFVAYKLISCLSSWLKQAKRARFAEVALADEHRTRSSATPSSAGAIWNARLSAPDSDNRAPSALGARLPAVTLIAEGLSGLDVDILAAQGPLDLLLPAPPMVNINGMPMLGGIDGVDIFGNAYGETINDPQGASNDYRAFEIQQSCGGAHWCGSPMDFSHGADYGASVTLFGG